MAPVGIGICAVQRVPLALSTNIKLSWLRGAGPGEEERDVLRQWHGTLKQLWEDAQKV